MEDEFDTILKIVIIGDSGVGKTNLVSRYLHNTFKEDTKATIGVEFGEKPYTFNGSKIKAQIWDTAGQERYRSIATLYYKGAKGNVVVYDVTQRTSFENVEKWINQTKQHTDPNISLILVANKIDLVDNREVTKEEGEEKAKTLGIPYLETSAKDSINVDKAFNSLIEDIASKEVEEDDDQLDIVPSNSTKGVDLKTNTKEEKGCC